MLTASRSANVTPRVGIPNNTTRGASAPSRAVFSMIWCAIREIVRPTSAADINSLGPLRKAASPVALMRDLDLLLRLSGRIVKGCRLPGSLALLACENDPGRAGVELVRRRGSIGRHICHTIPPER